MTDAMVNTTSSVHPAKDPGKWPILSSDYSSVEGMTLSLAQEVVLEVHQLSPLDAPDAIAFDNSCGTGAVTTMLKTAFPDLRLISANISEGLVDKVITKVHEKRWRNVDARVLNAANLTGIEDDSITHTLSTFIMGEPHQAWRHSGLCYMGRSIFRLLENTLDKGMSRARPWK